MGVFVECLSTVCASVLLLSLSFCFFLSLSLSLPLYLLSLSLCCCFFCFVAYYRTFFFDGVEGVRHKAFGASYLLGVFALGRQRQFRCLCCYPLAGTEPTRLFDTTPPVLCLLFVLLPRCYCCWWYMIQMRPWSSRGFFCGLLMIQL